VGWPGAPFTIARLTRLALADMSADTVGEHSRAAILSFATLSGLATVDRFTPARRIKVRSTSYLPFLGPPDEESARVELKAGCSLSIV